MDSGEIVSYVSALTDIRLSPGGGELSPAAARLLALLIAMPDPDVQTPSEFQFYVQQHGVRMPREFERGSLPGLQKSLTKAHDNLAKQVGINTRLYVLLTATQQSALLWRRILGAAIVVQFAIIGWLIQEFLHRFHR